MILNNVLDFCFDYHGNIDTDIQFHIPDNDFYEEYKFPYHLSSDGSCFLNRDGEIVVFNIELIESRNWEVFADE